MVCTDAAANLHLTTERDEYYLDPMNTMFRWKRWVAAGIVAALLLYWPLLFLLTHLPPSNVPSVGVSHDKLAHFCAYFGLTFLLTLALLLLCRFRWELLLYAIVATALYGAIDELTQLFVGRTADLRDWLADVTGAIAGALVATACFFVAKRLRDWLYPP